MDDFSQTNGSSNTSAVNPKSFLNAKGLKIINQIWQKAAYNQEIFEHYLENSRATAFPLTRSWVLNSGSSPNQIDVTCISAVTNDYQYKFYDNNGNITETGTLAIVAENPFTCIDLNPSDSSASHLGLLQILDNQMSLSFSSSRPTDLTNASTYTSD